MGTNSIDSAVAGERATAAQFNSHYNAMNGDWVPRNTSGVMTDRAGDLGLATHKWEEAHVDDGYIDNLNVTNDVDAGGKIVVPDGVELDTGYTITKSGTSMQHLHSNGRMLLGPNGSLNLKDTTEASDRLQVEDNTFIYRNAAGVDIINSNASQFELATPSGLTRFNMQDSGYTGAYLRDDTLDPDGIKTRTVTSSNQSAINHNRYYISSGYTTFDADADETNKVTWNFKGGPVTFFIYDITRTPETLGPALSQFNSSTEISMFLNDDNTIFDDNIQAEFIYKAGYSGNQSGRYATIFTQFIPPGLGAIDIYLECSGVLYGNGNEELEFKWGFYEGR